MTTNNITYAAFGDAMQYWNFFPTGDAAWGHMPVWGFADVVASHGGGRRGRRALLRLLSDREPSARAAGAGDGARLLRRRRTPPELTSAYNQYTRCSRTRRIAPQHEDHQMLLRPLFITSFMLADFLEDNAFFGARQVVVSSASSKTAYGTAFCLHGQRASSWSALTSQRNRGFVEGLGCYRQTRDLRRLDSLPADVPTLYVDFSGDDALRASACTTTSATRSSTTASPARHRTPPSCATPACPGRAQASISRRCQIKKRNADWGAAVVNRRFNEAQLAFIRR